MEKTRHEPFTDARWEDLAQTGLTRGAAQARRYHWTHLCDLEHELVERAGYARGIGNIENARALVAAVASGLPVEIDYMHRNGSTRRTVIVTQLFPPSENTPGRLCWRGWGHASTLRLDEIESVTVPEAEYRFE